MATSIQIDNLIFLRQVTLDCRDIFTREQGEDGGEAYMLKHTKTNVLNLSSLDPLRTTTKGKHEFLPKKIYVRDCMQEIFNKIVQANDLSQYAVVFGSPGVGKSVLSFLASHCYAFFIKKPVLFLRKTTEQTEDISVFLIKPPDADGKLTVQFARDVPSDCNLEDVHTKMLVHFNNLPDNSNLWTEEQIKKFQNPRPYLRQMCDGPRHGDKNHVTASDLVTSGGYETPKDEAKGEIISLPLSAWTEKEMVQACWHLFGAKTFRAKEIFDVCGGNIRKIAEVLEERIDLKRQREIIDEIVTKEGSKKKLKLAYESTSMSSTKGIGRLRAMFAKSESPGYYRTFQHIGSPYLLRLIKSELSMNQTLEGLKCAKQSGIQSLYGWHFELFGHKVFQESQKRHAGRSSQDNQAPPKHHSFTIAEGRGTGNESVKQLTTSNVYWTPSTSNFASIDAATGLDKTSYCIQYTVSSKHTFNCCTFLDFLKELPSEFRQDHPQIVVVFVVPSGVKFRRVVIPKSQESLKCGIKCGEGIELTFQKARSASKETEDEEKGQDGENEIGEDEGDEDKDDGKY